MRLAVIALFMGLVLGLIGAAVYQQYLLVPEPTVPLQQGWLKGQSRRQPARQRQPHRTDLPPFRCRQPSALRLAG